MNVIQPNFVRCVQAVSKNAILAPNAAKNLLTIYSVIFTVTFVTTIYGIFQENIAKQKIVN
jgi:hypothetical protein